ncbi:MAG: 5-oxoprolinase subunit B family protein [Mycobacterium sp.]
MGEPTFRPTIRNYGDRALLLECGSGDEALTLAATLREDYLPEIIDIVPGARTVLVALTSPAALAAVRARLTDLCIPQPSERSAPQSADVVIDVVYDGADLTQVAELTGMTADEVVEAHTGTPWRVGFGGFAPGFAYLVGGDPRLQVPRRAEPRTRVPAGSVALAGEFSGVYPRESPGGWQLIGRTDAVLWDVERPQPALLTPGIWVRFRATTGPA